MIAVTSFIYNITTDVTIFIHKLNFIFLKIIMPLDLLLYY